MTFLARSVSAVSVFFIVWLYGSTAPAVVGIFDDSDYFGIRGSIDEGTALLGQRFGGPDGRGDAQVFDVEEGVWTRSAYLADLLPPGALAIGADFGAGALAIDDNTALVAAYRNEVDGATQTGSVFLFSRDHGEWSYQDHWTQPLPPGATTPAPNALFGTAGDLDGDRAILVAGGTNTAYVYERYAGVWDDGTMLAGGDLATPIAAAIDQQVAVIGTFLDDGHVDVWRHDGEAWSHETQIATPQLDNLFAADVDVSGDTIVVAARDQTVGDQTEAGAVYVYHYDEGTAEWTLQQMIEHPEPAAGDEFGYSVAIEGDRLVVGAPRRDVTIGEDTISDIGAAYVFQRSDSTWTQVDKWEPDSATKGLWFGESVAVGEWSLLVGGSGRTTETTAGQGMVQLEGPVATNIPGDTDRDGIVDADDAATLALNWGKTNATWSMGDFNDDGVVNAVDAAMLAANWNATDGEAATTAVPEPSTLALLLGALLALTAIRRHNA